MKILFGNKMEKDRLSEFVENMKKFGLPEDVSMAAKGMKSTVEESVIDNRDNLDAVVLIEHLESTNPYDADDLVRLRDQKDDLKVILIIDESHKGGSYVNELYSKGFKDAIFVNDATPKNIAELLLKGRTAMDARSYYGIAMSQEEQASVDIPRYLNMIGNSTGGRLVAQLKRIESAMSKDTFALLIKKLSSEQKQSLRDENEYAIYVGENKEKKSGGLNFSININGAGNTTQTVFETINTEIIGVLSLKSRVGSTFVALNLAREISEKTQIVPAYLHLPLGDNTYTQHKFDEMYGTSFVSHLQEIMDNGTMGEVKNVKNGVGIICENPRMDMLENWSEQNSLAALYSSPNPTILDLGTTYDEQNNLVKYCNTLLFVVDSSATLEDITYIRNFLKHEKAQNISVVFNKCDSEDITQLAEHLADIPYITVMEYAPKYVASLFAYPKVSEGGIEKLIDLTRYGEFEKAKGKFNFQKFGSGFLSKIFSKQEKQSIVGCTEISVCGITRGCGTTYSTILLAHALAKRYKVAVLEQNNHCDFSNLDEFMSRQIDVEGVKGFRHEGVDYYYDTTYKKFASITKDYYEFVLIDYGSNGEFESDAYLRGAIKLVVAPSADWNLKKIDEYYSTYIKKFDKMGATSILVPLKANKELPNIRKICSENPVYSIALHDLPYEPSEECIINFERILNIKIR